MPQEKINRILIIRLGSLGDVLLTTPVIRSLKQKYPSAEIHFVVRKGFEDVIRKSPYVNRLFIFEKENPSSVRNELDNIRYDLIIDLQNNWRSRSLVKGFTGRLQRFHKPTLKKLLLVWTKINLLKNLISITGRYAEAADVKLDDRGLDLPIPAAVTSQLPEGKKYIGLCPGAKHFTKRWPAEYFIELGNSLTKLGFTVVLFGGTTERELCSQISSQIFNSINLQNDNQLFQIAVDMKKCSAVVSNDSGLMHVASAAGIPVIAIFGSTVKEFGFSPYGVKNLILENKSLSCRPCSHIGRSECPKKHFKCMEEIKPQYVLANTQKYLSAL